MLDAGGDSLRYSGDKAPWVSKVFELDVGAITASPRSVVVAALAARCRESVDAVRRWPARSSLRLSTSPLEARESEAATGP